MTYELNEPEEEPVEQPEPKPEPESKPEMEPTLADETAKIGAATSDGEAGPLPQVAAGDEAAEAEAPAAIDLGKCLRDAMGVYQGNFLALVVCAFLVEVLTFFSLGILGGVVLGGVSVITLQVLRHPQRKVDISALFSRFNQFVPLLIVFIIVVAVFLLGLLLLVLPGVVVATIWMYPILLVVDRRREPMAALQESYQLVRDNGFAAHLGLCAIILAMSFGSFFVPIVGVVISCFVAPLSWLMVASAYLQITGEHAPAADAADGETPVGDSALCGGCGYMLRGVSSFECPECGADLREVGMLPPSTSGNTQMTVAIALCVGIVIVGLFAAGAFLFG